MDLDPDVSDEYAELLFEAIERSRQLPPERRALLMVGSLQELLGSLWLQRIYAEDLRDASFLDLVDDLKEIENRIEEARDKLIAAGKGWDFEGEVDG